MTPKYGYENQIILFYFIFIFTFFSLAFAQFTTNEVKSGYKTNELLSNYINVQGFKFGINFIEAIQLYDIDVMFNGHICGYSKNTVDNTQYPIKEGFYQVCSSKPFANYISQNDAYVVKISKCIGFEMNFDIDEIQKNFKKKYNIHNLPAQIIHNGRYLIVDMGKTFRNAKTPSCLIISVADHTLEILDMEKNERSIKSSTDKLINKF